MAESHDARLVELVGELGGDDVRFLFRDLVQKALQELIDAELTHATSSSYSKHAAEAGKPALLKGLPWISRGTQPEPVCVNSVKATIFPPADTSSSHSS